MATIKGTKNPTSSTKGSVGDTYLNTETNTYFKCIMAYETIENKYYYWVKKSNGNSGGNISQEEIDKILKQLPTKVSDLTNDSMVSFAEQELTDDQKQQVLDNIGTARYQKCELTYNNKPITIYLKDGSITKPLDDVSDEVKTVWSTFVQKINTTLTVGNMPWSFRKSILSAFLNANLNGIIPDTFSYYGDAYYKKLIVFSRYKDNSGKYIASYTYDNKGVYARIAQYVDTGEYLSDVTSTKTEKPIMAHGTYQVDDDSVSANQFNLSSDPTSDMEVATKQYVDKNTFPIVHEVSTDIKFDDIKTSGMYRFATGYEYENDTIQNFDASYSTLIVYSTDGDDYTYYVTQILINPYPYNNLNKIYIRTSFTEMGNQIWNSWKDLTQTTAPFYIDSTSSDYSTSNASYGDQIKEALLSGCPVWYYGQETESGKTVSKYTQVTWFNIQQTDTEAKLIIGVGARSDGDAGGVTFTISIT